MSYFSNKLKGGFSIVPNEAIMDTSLSLQARCVFACMASKPEGWEFHAAKFAREIGCNIDSLRKYFRELVDAGWVKSEGQARVEANGKKNVFGATRYILQAAKDDASDAEVSVTGSFRCGKFPLRKISPTDNNIINNNKQEGVLSKRVEEKEETLRVREEIQSIYDAYPDVCEVSGNELRKVEGDKRAIAAVVEKYGYAYVREVVDAALAFKRSRKSYCQSLAVFISSFESHRENYEKGLYAIRQNADAIPSEEYPFLPKRDRDGRPMRFEDCHERDLARLIGLYTRANVEKIADSLKNLPYADMGAYLRDLAWAMESAKRKGEINVWQDMPMYTSRPWTT